MIPGLIAIDYLMVILLSNDRGVSALAFCTSIEFLKNDVQELKWIQTFFQFLDRASFFDQYGSKILKSYFA